MFIRYEKNYELYWENVSLWKPNWCLENFDIRQGKYIWQCCNTNCATLYVVLLISIEWQNKIFHLAKCSFSNVCAGLCRNSRRGCCERVHLKGRGEGQDDTQHCKTNKKSGNSHTRTLFNHICLNLYFQGTGKSGWCVIINRHLNWSYIIKKVH